MIVELVRQLNAVSANRLEAAAKLLEQARADHRIMFIGNGGSAALASHAAADWQKNGGFATMCFNDGAQLTALANDHGYDKVFQWPLMRHARPKDVLIAISSSGESPNILRAAEAALHREMRLITLSGFRPDNRLGHLGVINFHVPSMNYGVVETAHCAILHAMLEASLERR